MVAARQKAHHVQRQIELCGARTVTQFSLAICSSSDAVIDAVFLQEFPDAPERFLQMLHAVGVGNAGVAFAGSAKGVAGMMATCFCSSSFVQKS